MTLFLAVCNAICLPVAIVLGLYVVFNFDKRLDKLEKSQHSHYQPGLDSEDKKESSK